MITPPPALRAAVAFGLHGRRDDELGRWPLTREVIAAAVSHRVQGLLWRAIESGLFADSELIEEAQEAYLAALRTCMWAEETAILALDVLTAAGIETRVLKGVALARLDYERPEHRIFGDADLLIHPNDHRRALSVLAAAGFVRAVPPVRLWWERRFGKSIVFTSPTGGELDLHLRMTGGYFGERIDHDSIWQHPGEPVLFGDRPAVALDRESRLLQACCHSILGGGSGLRASCDVAQLILCRDVNWHRTAERAGVSGAGIVMSNAVSRAWRGLYLDPLHPVARWANDFTPDAEQVVALSYYCRALESGRWMAEGRSTLAALRARDRLRFAVGLVLRSSLSRRARKS
jgi:hypothetical protein